MRRRKSGLKRERIIMLSASAFVLTALTMMGVYVREKNNISDEYRVELDELNNDYVEEKANEIAMDLSGNLGETNDLDNTIQIPGVISNVDDLDADPNYLEANSPNVENPQFANNASEEETESDSQATNVEPKEEESDQETVAENVTAELSPEAPAPNVNYNFPTEQKLQWPVVGEVLVNFSMDQPIYFSTLQQYRYSPALVIRASEGENLTAAANGIVSSVFTSKELGNAISIDLGDGYELTYGQLTNITLKEGDVVSTGDIVGQVGTPSIFYTNEGSNVYFKLTQNGSPINPLELMNE